MPAIHLKTKAATMAQKKAALRSYVYLGNVSAMQAAMANEFGADVAMPPVSEFEWRLKERANQRLVTAHYAARKSGGKSND